MKLLTHNMLACHIKGVKNNYPFLIEAAKVETQDADYNPGSFLFCHLYISNCSVSVSASEGAGVCGDLSQTPAMSGLQHALGWIPLLNKASWQSCMAIACALSSGVCSLMLFVCLPTCADFLRHMFPRIQWPAFLQGAQSVSWGNTIISSRAVPWFFKCHSCCISLCS